MVKIWLKCNVISKILVSNKSKEKLIDKIQKVIIISIHFTYCNEWKIKEYFKVKQFFKNKFQLDSKFKCAFQYKLEIISKIS